MAVSVADAAEARVLPRTLAGATVLQLVPALRDTPQVCATIGIARALVQAGARAIVAGEHGALVDELRSFGGEWLPFASATFNPAKLRRNAEALEKFVAAERVDIVHAKSAGATWSALAAIDRSAACLITDLPGLPPTRMWLAAFYLGAIRRSDRVISHSMFNARPVIVRHRIPVERVSVVPHSIDLASFNPAAVPAENIARLRHSWGIPSGVRVVLVPGRLAPWNGQLVLVDAARILVDEGTAAITFVLVGDDRRHPRFARSFVKRARALGVDALFRMVGHHADMASAYAASDVVVVPYAAAPVYGRVVAEAQAMARPIVVSSVGPLPESILAPPRVTEDLRTGWEVPPNNAAKLAQAISTVLSLDEDAYRALRERARQYAQSMFALERVAAATLEIYESVLENAA
jgi:glycosyltransferase involved in cell wall biosynthesis